MVGDPSAASALQVATLNRPIGNIELADSHPAGLLLRSEASSWTHIKLCKLEMGSREVSEGQ